MRAGSNRKYLAALNVVAKIMVDYEVDSNDPRFTDHDRDILNRALNDLRFYDPERANRYDSQQEQRRQGKVRAGERADRAPKARI